MKILDHYKLGPKTYAASYGISSEREDELRELLNKATRRATDNVLKEAKQALDNANSPADIEGMGFDCFGNIAKEFDKLAGNISLNESMFVQTAIARTENKLCRKIQQFVEMNLAKDSVLDLLKAGNRGNGSSHDKIRESLGALIEHLAAHAKEQQRKR